MRVYINGVPSSAVPAGGNVYVATVALPSVPEALHISTKPPEPAQPKRPERHPDAEKVADVIDSIIRSIRL